MKALIEWIKWAVASIWEILKSVFLWCLDIVWKFFQTVVNFIVDSALSLIEFFIGLIDFKNDLFSDALNWANVPENLTYILVACGISNVLLILSSALLIRLTLNLIPGSLTRV